MAVLSNLEPKKVFRFFEDICSIPHGSGNIWQVSNYCADFARQRGLEFVQDEMGNVIIYAPGTPGYEDAEPVILQGHIDMVCVKTEDCPLDMSKDGLELMVDGDYVRAKDTSLGADNGIGVALAMAVLESSTLAHPELEVLFTVNEEEDLSGADGFDTTKMQLGAYIRGLQPKIEELEEERLWFDGSRPENETIGGSFLWLKYDKIATTGILP